MEFASCVKIPDDLARVGKIFSAHGYQAYLVGGAVRDILRGAPGHDWDVATDATPAQVTSLFRRVIPTGIAHGTVTVHILGHEIEVTTFRTEAGYSDGRHPDAVAYAATLEEDLSRRDFTMNAVAADLGTGRIVDPHGGREDIRRGIIRTVGEPFARFGEDGLRPVRAVRFAGQLGFTIEGGTLAALSAPAVLERTALVSVERFRDEFCKMLLTKKPSVCLRLLEQTGMLAMFIPQFTPCRGCGQADARGFHEFDVADHTFYACDGAPADNLTVRLAAFYHDIGKPECRATERTDGGTCLVHFHGHERASARIAEASLRALRFSGAEIDRVCHLVREHMFLYDSSWKDAAIRRFIVRVGKENIGDLIALRYADIHGMHNRPLVPGSPAHQALMELRARVDGELGRSAALSIRDLAVNGRDLIACGIPSGRALGGILAELFEAVTDSPAMNRRETLERLALQIYRTKYQG